MGVVWNAVKGYLRTVDRWLVFFYLFASGLSIMFLYGIFNSGLDGIRNIYAQTAAVGMGLVAAIIISLFDYHTLLKLWKLYMPLCVIFVLLTLTSLGEVVGGNQAWINFPIAGHTFSFQPSELLKISMITTLALHIDKVKEDLNAPLNVLLLLLHGGAHIFLIYLQSDDGTALIFTGIFLVMIFCAGISWKYIIGAVLSLVLIVPFLWFYMLSDNQKTRILILFNPELDTDAYFQQARSAIALGIGGVQGTGVFSGRHVPVPKAYNDFIFSFIGESLGFMGCIGVMLLLCAIAFKLLYNSHVAKDDVGRLICIGLFAMFIAQTFINLGMCIGLLPVIGITLPLFSSGGSSVLALYLGLGLVLSVYRHSSTGLFGD